MIIFTQSLLNMEYDITDTELPKAVLYFLSLHPNEHFTTYEIHQRLFFDKICLKLKNNGAGRVCVQVACKNALKEYNGIKCTHGDTYYLDIPSKVKYNFDEIENIVNNPSEYSHISFDGPYKDDETQTLLHIICENNRLDLLKKISKEFDINFLVTNASGQSLADVIPQNDM